MSSTSHAAPTSESARPSSLIEWFKGHLTPYHLFVASVLGGITVAFATVIILLIIVSLNFNVLGWIE